MRALLDRHQADLFYAMQLVFDRLGIEVYTPVGYEWWDEGYWQFGHQHLGRALADQYLNLDAKYSQCNCREYWKTWDPAHPERVIRCVTLAQFRALGDWSHIVATVQDNQAGFHRLAAETGAKYVLQVGNTRQDVDWALDPLALVSSEVPIAGRGVLIHQPFDHTDTFRYRDPDEAQPLISSFVNLMPRLDEWPIAADLLARLPFPSRIYGIDGPDGNLHPVYAIADAMAQSAFGLHIKPTGDGFGHVIHNWAAVGRPLVGHARYYRGQMAERFWQDGVTCVDLDQRSPQEAADLIIAIWADKPRYRAMCEAIRAEFDRIDWNGEADAVRGLLL
jgi:glycosyltransferase involved in cell wall biosynthesis